MTINQSSEHGSKVEVTESNLVQGHRYGFSSFLSNTKEYQEAPKEPPEDLELWVAALKEGDMSVKDKIIAAHYRIAATIVAQFARFGPKRSDDLLGEALFALTQAVVWSGPHLDDKNILQPSRLRDNNITPYITTTIRSFLRKYIERDRVLGMPGRTFRSKAKAGKIHPTENIDVTIKSVVSVMRLVMSDDPISNDHDDGYKTEKGPLPPYAVLMARQEEPSIELTEVLELAVVTENERKIVELRSQGYTYKDIAEKLGLSHQRIGQIMPIIEARFDEMFG